MSQDSKDNFGSVIDRELSVGVLLRVVGSLGGIVLSGRMPSKRAVAAVAKLCGRRPTRKFPFLPKGQDCSLGLEFSELLEFQYARNPEFVALVVGAFDGMTNDPTSEFVRTRCFRAILVEPQLAPFERLRENMKQYENIKTINAAIDGVSGWRDIYYVSPYGSTLPPWTEQLASFRKQHVLKHEENVPGLSRYVLRRTVKTISFEDLLEKYDVRSLDLLQVDAEGTDAELLESFPFDRIKPALLYYETVHMSAKERRVIRERLTRLGYIIRRSSSMMDDIAVLF